MVVICNAYQNKFGNGISRHELERWGGGGGSFNYLHEIIKLLIKLACSRCCKNFFPDYMPS